MARREGGKDEKEPEGRVYCETPIVKRFLGAIVIAVNSHDLEEQRKPAHGNWDLTDVNGEQGRGQVELYFLPVSSFPVFSPSQPFR